MEKVKMGIFGLGRGSVMAHYCSVADDAELVAICDRNEDLIKKLKKHYPKYKNVKSFTSFDEFLEKGGMDAVMLANFADDHAPFAVRCLNKGIHVFSEVLPVANLKEAVELVDAVEKSGKVYSYAENYCFFSTTAEMKRLIKDGTLGDFEYGEGEYMHNCHPSWKGLTKGDDPDHWRNRMSAFYYCTHSVGPMLHISGQRPVQVVGVEGVYGPRCKEMKTFGASMAVEIVTLENGAIFKSIHGVAPTHNSIWYMVSGSKGRAETAREYAALVYRPLDKIYLLSKVQPEKPRFKMKGYRPKLKFVARKFGHSGSDWYTPHNFVQKILGNEADIVDVYEALDMYLVGHMGYISALNGNAPTAIPNFRDPAVRAKYADDTSCCFPEKACGKLLPSRTALKEKE